MSERESGATGIRHTTMIANARMYSISPEVADLWRRLLSALIADAGARVTVIAHPAPRPLAELWRRSDNAAVFMCGLPFSRAEPQPELVAAPVPTPSSFADRAGYWSEFVVRTDSGFDSVEATFGRRIAFTVPDSQSGCVAALTHFMGASRAGGTGAAVGGASPAASGARGAGSAPQVDDGAGETAAGASPVPGGTGAAAGGASPVVSSAPRGGSASRTAAVETAAGTGQTAAVPLYREIVGPVVTPLGALTAVVQGKADIAPIDAYALRLLEIYRVDLTSQVRVVGRTAWSPIPPLVASAGQREVLQGALLRAHRNPAAQSLMDKLLLRRFAPPDPAAYAGLRERFEVTARYWHAHRFAAMVPAQFVTNPG
jgi:ABC-type phosphate/phosphonate transport system substrate-binding protein